MSIEFKCSGCGKAMTARDEMAGKKMRCKSCSAITAVPAAPPAPKPPQASPATLPVASLLSPPPPSEATAPDRPKPALVLPVKPLADVTINFKCSGCSRPMSVRGDLGGKKIRCKGCGAVTSVPPAEGAPADAAKAEPAPAPAAAPSSAAAPASPVPAVPAPEAPMQVTVTPPVVQLVSAAPEVPAPAAPPPATPTAAPAAGSPATGEVEMAALRRRAEQAEQAIHNIAGQHALEKIALTNRILALEAQVRDLEARLRAGPQAGLSDVARTKLTDWLDGLVAAQDKAIREQVGAARKLLAPPVS